MKLLSIFLLFFLATACDQNAVHDSNQTEDYAKTSPSVAPAEIEEKQKKIDDNEKQKAIENFIAQKYKGWKLEGVASGYSANQCKKNKLCDLHLTNNGQNKVITIILKNFSKKDGSLYWLVREAQQIDLSKAKIESIKQDVLENLTAEDIDVNLRQSILEDYEEEQADYAGE